MEQIHYGIPENIFYNERYSAPIYRSSSIADIPWSEFELDAPVHISIRRDAQSLPLEALYIPRDHSNLLVALHGGLEKRDANQPYFQYVWSFKSRPESLLFIFDSTLYLDPDLYSSYYIGTPDQDLVAEYAALINSLRAAAGLDRTLLCGHSSGGTGALKIGSRIANSRAIVGNPMLADTRFAPRHLERTRELVFPESNTTDDFYRDFSERIFLSPWLESRVAGSTFSWFVHTEDISMTTNFTAKRASSELGLDVNTGGNTAAGDALVVCNWDYPRSSHMLPFVTKTERYSFLPFVERTLDEKSEFQLKILAGTDPVWRS